MNNDLIERWKAVTCPPNDYIAELIAETIDALSPVPHDQLTADLDSLKSQIDQTESCEGWKNQSKTLIDRVIDALSPVLPEVVENCCNHLRATADDLGAKIYADYADPIDRLVREKSGLQSIPAPVLAKDVQQMCQELDDARHYCLNNRDAHVFPESIALIKRLARNCKTIEESRDYWMREAEGLQQRIEELGQVIARNHEHAKGLKAQIAELKRIRRMK